MSCIITYKGQKYLEEQFKEYFINNKQEFATPIAKNKDVIDSFKRKMEGIDYVFSQSPELASIGSKAQYLQYLSTIFKTSKVKDIVYRGDKSKTVNGVTQFLKGERKDLLFLSTNKEVAKNTLYYSDFSEFIYKKDEFGNLTMTTENEPNESKNLVRGPKNFISAIVNIQNPLVKNAENQSYKNYKIDGKSEYETIKYAKEKIKNQENDSLIVENVLEGDVSRLPSTNIGLRKPEQIHILSSKQDIEGFKQFLKKDDESIYYKNLEDEIKVLEEDKIKIAEKRRNFREWINRFTTLNEVKNDNQKLLESRRQVFKDLGFTETYDNTFELKTSSYVTLISKKQALDDNPLIRFDGKLTGVKYTQKSVDGTYILTYKLDDITKTSIREAQIKGEMPFTKSDLKETLKSEDFLNSVSENIFDGLSPEETQIIKEKLESGEYNINCKL